MKNMLITGISGFVGKNLLPLILDRCPANITITLTAPEKEADFYSSFIDPLYNIKGPDKKILKIKEKTNYVQADLYNLDKDAYLLFNRPDIVVDLAWKGLPDYKASMHIQENFITHYQFLKSLVEKGTSRVVVTGTCFEYGMKDGCLDESMKCCPDNSYGLAKDFLRKSLFALQEEQDFTLSWIRLFYLYGPYQNRRSIVPLLLDAISKGKEEFPMSGGEQIRDYLSIEQACSKIADVIFKDFFNGVVNCCSGKGISVRRLVEDVIAQRQSLIKPKLGGYPYASHEPFAFWGSSKKFDNLFRKDLK